MYEPLLLLQCARFHVLYEYCAPPLAPNMIHDNQIEISYSLSNTASLSTFSTSTSTISSYLHKHCCRPFLAPTYLPIPSS